MVFKYAGLDCCRTGLLRGDYGGRVDAADLLIYLAYAVLLYQLASDLESPAADGAPG